MSLVIATNTSAQLAQDALRANQHKTATAMQRLATGLRINSARDDAAGLAISQSMTSQIRGLNQAVRNINDGVNLLQTAEGGLGSITDMLQRMRELAVQSANGTYSGSQRAYLQKEAAALQEQISKVVDTTTWNDKKLLDGSFTGQKIQVGADSGATMDISIGKTQIGGNNVFAGQDGTFYVAGSTASNFPGFTNAGGQDAFLTKYGADGALIWTRQLGSTSNDWAHSVAVSSDGSVYIAGETYGSIDGQAYGGGNDAFLTKFSPDGTKQWTQVLGGTGGEAAYGVSAAADGSVYITGGTTESLDGVNSNGIDTFLSKYSSDGTLQYTKQFPNSKFSGGWNRGFAMTTADDGSAIVVGHSWTGAGNGFATKFAKDGSEIWTQEFSGTGDTVAEAVATSADGSIYITGRTGSNLGGESNAGSYDAFLSKLAPDGNVLYTHLVGSAQYDGGAGVVVSQDGSVYMSGNTQGNIDAQIGPPGGPFLSKFTPNGDLLWTKQNWDGAAVSGLVANSDGTITTTGIGNGRVAKYDSDGTRLWQFSSDIWNAAPEAISNARNVLVDISTQDGASRAIGVIDSTLDTVNSTRSTIGSYINRLNYAADNATNISTNIAASRSAIQDTDYAEESANLAKSQITQQAATAMLAQANQQPQSVLALLKNL